MLVLIILAFACRLPAQEPVWTWLDGSPRKEHLGIYGTQGVPSPENVPGGELEFYAWAKNGSLHLFGQGIGDFWSWDGLNWTWTGGDRLPDQRSVYGEKGVPDPNNSPGKRVQALTWVLEEDLYLFGGFGYDAAGEYGMRNDLWKWDGHAWTWISGSNTHGQPSSGPSPRYGATGWVHDGNLYLFGGNYLFPQDEHGWRDPPNDFYNDLWKWDGASWQRLQANDNADTKPSSRAYATGWVVNGKLYLFGGYEYYEESSPPVPVSKYYNDLWVWDGAGWIRIDEGEGVNQPGKYGTKGQADASNRPGSRTNALAVPAGEAVLLFGGNGLDAEGDRGPLNDLWKWDGNQWTWVSGATEVKKAGNYGAKGVPATDNFPGARTYTAGAFLNDQLFIFGGEGRDARGVHVKLNDLWTWDGTTWTWMSGDSLNGVTAIYGDKGQAGPGNRPGGRGGAATWTSSDSLFLFGGYGYDEYRSIAWADDGLLNDLWTRVGDQWIWLSGGTSFDQAGVYGAKGQAAPENNPGSRRYAASWTLNGELYLFGGEGFDANGEKGPLNDLWKWDGSQWTWISGSKLINQTGGEESPGNLAPGARQDAAVWELNGSIYLFGGNGLDETGVLTVLNDFWMWDGQGWRLISRHAPGADAVPRERYGTVSWTLNSELYLFGGKGWSLYLNDLWKWDGTDWVQVFSPPGDNQSGVYGEKGVPAPGNMPGSRVHATGWTTGNDLLLFGGKGYDSDGYRLDLSDLWKWDGANWTWISGLERGLTSGHYGDKGSADPENFPGSLHSSAAWTLGDKLYLFGGSRSGVGETTEFLQLEFPGACPPPAGSPELAGIAYYNGPTQVSTASGSAGLARILLTASIHDICAGSGEAAKLDGVRVNFIDRASGQPVHSEPLPVQALDALSGTVAYAWPVDIGSAASVRLRLGIQVLNYYGRDLEVKDVEIEVYRPQSDMVTGGGYLRHTGASAGRLAADPGSKAVFFLHAKYNTRQTRLQGGVFLTIYHTDEEGRRCRYYIYTPHLNTLYSSEDTDAAVLTGPAHVLDRSRRRHPAFVTDAATLMVELEDWGSPGRNDRIAFSLYDQDGALLYASQWDGKGPVLQQLDGGNVRIHRKGDWVLWREEAGEEAPVLPDMRLYPIPAGSELTVAIQSTYDGEATYRVFDFTGRLLIQKDITLIRGANELRLPVSHLPEGSYVLQVVADDLIVSRKFTVAR